MRNTGLFVIFRPDAEKYLFTFVEDQGRCDVGWCAYPKQALTYGSQQTAASVAQRVADRKGCRLLVCELAESERQVAVRDVCEVGPATN